MFGLEVKHFMRVINPYSIEKMILLVMWSEGLDAKAEWILHDGSGEELSRGWSKHSDLHSTQRQALINGQSYARRYLQKKYPMLNHKTHWDTKIKDGEQISIGELDA